MHQHQHSASHTLKLYVRLIVVCKPIDCTFRVHTKSKLNESNQDQRKDETINMKPVIPKYLETYKLIHIYIYTEHKTYIFSVLFPFIFKCTITITMK